MPSFGRLEMNWLRVISYAVLILLVIPVLVLLYEGFGPMSTPSGYSSGVFRSIELTMLGSAIAVFVAVVLYTPLAYYFARNESTITQSIADIPASIPHPIVGIALLILVSPLTSVGQFLISIGFDLFNTLLGYVVCLVIVVAPIYIKAMQPFFESMNIRPKTTLRASGLAATKIHFHCPAKFGKGNSIRFSDLHEQGNERIRIHRHHRLPDFAAPFYGVSPSAVFIVTEYISGSIWSSGDHFGSTDRRFSRNHGRFQIRPAPVVGCNRQCIFTPLKVVSLVEEF